MNIVISSVHLYTEVPRSANAVIPVMDAGIQRHGR